MRKYYRLLGYIFIDTISFYISLILAFYIRKSLNVFLSVKFNTPFEFFFKAHGIIILFIFLFCMAFEGAYKYIYSFLEEFKLIFKAVVLFFILTFAFVGIIKAQNEYSRLMLGILSINLFIITMISRKIFKNIMLKNPTIIIGWNDDVKDFFERSKPFLEHIYNVEYIFDRSNIGEKASIFNKDIYIKSIENLKDIMPKDYTVFVASENFDDFREFSKLVSKLKNISKDIILIEDYNKLTFVSSHMIAFPMTRHFLLSVSVGLGSKLNQALKSVIDYTISFVLLPIFLVLILIFAVLIKLDSKGPVFFTQDRVGKDGKKFKIYKFRTMYEDAEQRLKELLESDENLKKEWEIYRKLKNDPRITKVGKFLRKTSLDELPQLINILKGEMSLIGPRPCFEEELKNLYKEYAYLYIMLKPGITGFWQVSGRNDASFETRVLMEAFYSLNWSLWLDFYILLKTIKVVIKKEGAY